MCGGESLFVRKKVENVKRSLILVVPAGGSKPCRCARASEPLAFPIACPLWYLVHCTARWQPASSRRWSEKAVKSRRAMSCRLFSYQVVLCTLMSEKELK